MPVVFTCWVNWEQRLYYIRQPERESPVWRSSYYFYALIHEFIDLEMVV